MSLVMVLAVAVVVFLYVRTSRRARQAWLVKLDLPGRWRLQTGANASPDEGALELLLQGKVDSGEFVLQEESATWRGEWQLSGHAMRLRGGGREETFDLHYFKPGNIGLQNAAGVRRLYTKAATNVVPLRAQRESILR